jgi:hypothetical protein
MLNPTLGRFNQRDPLGYVDGMSVYEYVRSAATLWLDPFGLEGRRNMTDIRREMADIYSGMGNTEAAKRVMERDRQASNSAAIAAGTQSGLNEAGRQIKNEVTDPTNAAAALVPGGKAAKNVGKKAKKTGLLGKAWRGVKRLRGFGDDAADAGRKSVDDLIDGSRPGRPTKGRTRQWDREGGVDQANEDFDNLRPNGVTQRPDGSRTGHLEDGKKVTVRPRSSDGRPTLEVQEGKNRTKFRYNER